MKHNITLKKLSRRTGHRLSLIKNLTKALMQYGYIKTTLSKAKVIRPYIEKLITYSRRNTLHTGRQIISCFGNCSLTMFLLTRIKYRYISRPGGYTRILKYGYRKGDSSPKGIITLV